MHSKTLLAALATLSAVSDAATIPGKSPFARALQRRSNGAVHGRTLGSIFHGGFERGDEDDDSEDGPCSGIRLDPEVLQDASASDGSPDESAGQAPSLTDDSNFINFCKGKQITNGQQWQDGSCNGIPMGEIPATNQMVAAVFTYPQNGAELKADETFQVKIQTTNFAPGSFVNPKAAYYSAPQHLDDNGHIIGHTHVTVQSTGDSLNPTTPLDPQKFVFFKGINDEGNGEGLLSATVEGGLPIGNYRLCSMVSAANHQPVIMPVAQRGAQDDCVRFTVSETGSDEPPKCKRSRR